MSAYQPPRENLVIFENSVFTSPLPSTLLSSQNVWTGKNQFNSDVSFNSLVEFTNNASMNTAKKMYFKTNDTTDYITYDLNPTSVNVMIMNTSTGINLRQSNNNKLSISNSNVSIYTRLSLGTLANNPSSAYTGINLFGSNLTSDGIKEMSITHTDLYAGTDKKNWGYGPNNDTYYFYTTDDLGTNQTNIMSFTRNTNGAGASASTFYSSLDISNNPINFAGGAYMSWNTSVPAVAPNRVHFLTSTASSNQAALTISTDAPRIGVNNFNPLYTLDVGGNANIQTQVNAASVLISTLAGGGNRSISVDNTGLVIVTPSDKRLKKDINCLSGNIIDDYFDKLNPVEYKWIDDETYGTQKEYGFIADEIKELYPNLIYRASIDASGNEFMGFNQPSLIPILTSVIQKLKSRLIQLEDKYSLLEDNVAMLLSRI